MIQEFRHYFLVDGVKIHWNFKLLPSGFEAITLFGHVFDVRPKEQLKKYLETYAGKVMVHHEKLHMIQAESFKLKYFTFYIVYLYYYFKCGIKMGWEQAYYNIPFEREAYANEDRFDYNITNWKCFTYIA